MFVYGDFMGLLRAEIELIRTADLFAFDEGRIKRKQIRRMKVQTLVDTGALTLVINETVREQLKLKTLEQRTATLADGSVFEADVVGPVDIRYANREATVRAIVVPGDAECLLGAIPIEDMDLVIDLGQQKLVVNPAHPIKAQMTLKGLR